MKIKSKARFIVILIAATLAVLVANHIGDAYLSSVLLDKYAYRTPNYRQLDWFYNDILQKKYIDVFVKKYGAERIIAFVGDSVVYTHGTSANSTYCANIQDLLDYQYGKGAYIVLNIGCDGTAEAFLRSSIQNCLRADIKHIYACLNLKDYVKIDNWSSSLYSNETKYFDETNYLAEFGNSKRKIPEDEFFLRRGLISLFPWIGYGTLIKSELGIDIGLPMELANKIAAESVEMPENLDTANGIVISKLFQAKYKENKREDFLKLLSLEEKKIYNANMYNLNDILAVFSDFRDEITFVINPLNMTLEYNNKIQQEAASELLQKMILHSEFDVYAEELYNPEYFYRPDDAVHFNFYGSWFFAQMLIRKDSYLNALVTDVEAYNFQNFDEASLPKIKLNVSDLSRIGYLSGSQNFRLVSLGSERTTFDINSVHSFYVKGYVENSGQIGSPKIYLMDKFKRQVIALPLHDGEFWIKRSSDQIEIMTSVGIVKTVYGENDIANIAIGYMDNINADRECIIGFTAAWAIYD